MKKTLPLTIIVFIAVLIGGYCILWYSQASQLKSQFEQAVAEINQKSNYVTYESIGTSGFPLYIDLTLSKPHFTGRVDTLIKDKLAAMPESQNKREMQETLAKFPEWNEDIQLDGTLVFRMNATSDDFTLTANGKWAHTSKIADRTISGRSENQGTSQCQLQFAKGSALTSLWSFKAFEAKGEELAHNFRLFDCNDSASVFVDTKTNEVLFKQDVVRTYLTSEPQGNQQALHLYVKFGNYELTPKGDALLDHYFTLIKIADPYSIPVKYSVFGAINVEVDMTANIPQDFANPPPGALVELNINKLNISNALYNSTGTLAFSGQETGDNAQGKLTFKSEGTTAPAYDDYVRSQAKGFIDALYANMDKKDEMSIIKNEIIDYTPDQLYSIVLPAIPNFASLGKQTIAMDASYNGSKNFTSGDLALSNMELTFAPYGITAQGNVKQTQGQMVPAANVKLSCTHCPLLVDDVTSYIERVRGVIAYFDPEKAAAFSISPQLSEGIKNFLIALAGNNNETLVYTIISDPASGVTLNGKNIMELQTLFSQYIAPALQPAAASPEMLPQE